MRAMEILKICMGGNLHTTIFIHAESFPDGCLYGFPEFIVDECLQDSGVISVEIPSGKSEELKVSVGYESFKMELRLDDGCSYAVSVPYVFIIGIQVMFRRDHHHVENLPTDMEN